MFVCGKKEKKKEEKEKDGEEEKDVSLRDALWTHMSRRDTRDTLVQNRDVHSSAARERLSFSFVAFTS